MVKVNVRNTGKEVPVPWETPATPPADHAYRRSASSPITRVTNQTSELKASNSLPGLQCNQSTDLFKIEDDDRKLPFLLLEALAYPVMQDSELGSDSKMRFLSSRSTVSRQQTLEQAPPEKTLRKVKRTNSIETPSLIKSDLSFPMVIQPIDEYPLYRVINDAVGDLAGLMSSNVLKKKIRNQEKIFDITKSKTESLIEEESLNISQDVDMTISQADLTAKGFNLYNKPTPTQISSYLKKKCSLWRQQNKKRLSIPSSLSVNITSEIKEDSPLENKINNEDDGTQIQYQPNHNIQLVKKLMEECTPHNIIYRNIRKGMFPYRLNPKDFPDVHTADLNISRHFLQTLTGHDRVMLNMRPSMVKIHQFMVHKHSKEVDRHRKKLEEKETKRLRKLQVQGIVHPNYDETENATDNFKLAEKPHITYNSLKPIFNENPFASAYKCMVRQFNRELIMKEKEEDDVASIGEVSFVSSSSSFKNVFDRADTLENIIQMPQSSDTSEHDSIHSKQQSCIKYLMPINQRLMQLDNDTKLSAIYQTSEPLMYQSQK